MGAATGSTIFQANIDMDELFSCRNCIHNCGQTLIIGRGVGFCLQHNSVILNPERTTCKYLHRKDLPHFVVDEGIREHAAEFTLFPRLVTLDTKEPIEQVRYSEERSWNAREFDPLTHAHAQYHKASKKWLFIQAFTAGTDGRRSIAHASLVRHYMYQCNKWTSSYRLVLGLIEEIDNKPQFTSSAFVGPGEPDQLAEDALWDVVFTRLSAVQEYGWHAGLVQLVWASDDLNGSLAEFKWPSVQTELSSLRQGWSELIISHAKAHGVFFPAEPLFDDEPDEG